MSSRHAILFDLDGTLATYTGNFPQLLFKLARDAGIPEDDKERFADELIMQISLDKALTLHSALEDALRALGYRVPAKLERIVEGTLHAYSLEVRLLPGARTLLEEASAEMPLALVTNGPSDMQRRAIHALDIATFFKAIVISGDAEVGVRKPNPDIFRLACRRLGVAPEDAMMVGDSRVADIDGALAAGMQAIEVGPDVDRASFYRELAAYLER